MRLPLLLLIPGRTRLARVVRAVLVSAPQSARAIDGKSLAAGSCRGVDQVCCSMLALDLSLLNLCGALQVFTNGRQ